MHKIISWFLYCAGHVVSKPMNKCSAFGFLYPLYNWLMMKSVQVQGSGSGPWKTTNKV